MRICKTFLCCIAVCCFTQTHAQGFLNKVKQKAQAAADVLSDKKTGQADQTNSSTPGTSANTNNRSFNNKGQGLINTPPDVKKNLTNARNLF